MSTAAITYDIKVATDWIEVTSGRTMFTINWSLKITAGDSMARQGNRIDLLTFNKLLLSCSPQLSLINFASSPRLIAGIVFALNDRYLPSQSLSIVPARVTAEAACYCFIFGGAGRVDDRIRQRRRQYIRLNLGTPFFAESGWPFRGGETPFPRCYGIKKFQETMVGNVLCSYRFLQLGSRDGFLSVAMASCELLRRIPF